MHGDAASGLTSISAVCLTLREPLGREFCALVYSNGVPGMHHRRPDAIGRNSTSTCLAARFKEGAGSPRGLLPGLNCHGTPVPVIGPYETSRPWLMTFDVEGKPDALIACKDFRVRKRTCTG